MIVSVVSKIYTDTGGPGLTIYRPQCPPGFCILGDYSQEGDINKPNHGVMICVLMQSDSNLVVPAKGFTQVWSSEGPGSGRGFTGDNDDESSCFEGSYGSESSASGDGDVLAFWEPKVPSREYIALGHVATTNYQPPSESHVCVVHKSVASPGIPGKRLWVEESRMASIWTLAASYHYLNISENFSESLVTLTKAKDLLQCSVFFYTVQFLFVIIVFNVIQRDSISIFLHKESFAFVPVLY